MTTDPPHQRRIRYPGRNPRRFQDKYKEHDPARYAADVEKIIASGKTPAGTHRPICVREILEILAPQSGEIAVDATLGYGGHALEIARALQPGGRLYGLDVDPIELPKTEARLHAAGLSAETLAVRRMNFAGLLQLLAAENLTGVDIILADLGLSSMQMDDPSRGFSFKVKAPLDLRMNPQHGRPASALLAALNEAGIVELLAENADEPHARLISRSVCETHTREPVATTTALAAAVRRGLSGSGRQLSKDEVDLSIRRTFQALRIAVNDEFNALDSFLRNLPACLKPGGRVALLSFHSGEDRRVKKAFQAGEREGVYASIAQEVTRPGVEEIRSNPRSSSAKLRWAIKA